ncbi:uncharacterized protein LOC122503202 [Leptopilina heterotoma]|uniref:uncharacterized protein LOC122503202 n=1 Tax=Leptopilina heterotoma TaxID=63436 RepID=UPI001CA7B8AB|nr:uncharacterized protein LOC122503202 [Leptopilina heterotoma]
MKLSISEICKFSDCTPSSRNFVEGERVWQADHIIFCGQQDSDETSIKIISFCLQSSNLKSAPHQIKGEINLCGSIIKMTCSCKAGLSEKCKHIVAVLLHLNSINIMNLELCSCTNTTCLWSASHQKALEVYEPAPLRCHSCFVNEFEKEYDLKITGEDEEFIKDLLFKCDLNSALAKDMYG